MNSYRKLITALNAYTRLLEECKTSVLQATDEFLNMTSNDNKEQ